MSRHSKPTKKDWCKRLDIPIYECFLIIGVGNTTGILEKKAFPNIKDTKEYPACCVYTGPTVALFFTRPYLKPSVISHECTHGALRIAEHCGWGHLDETTEPFAYLQAWMVRMVNQELAKHKERILRDD